MELRLSVEEIAEYLDDAIVHWDIEYRKWTQVDTSEANFNQARALHYQNAYKAVKLSLLAEDAVL